MTTAPLLACLSIVPLVAACTPVLSSGERSVKPRPKAEALSHIPKLMDEALVPGLQVAMIIGGRFETPAFGIRDVQIGAPVTTDTVFEGASLGKAVFAYGVLRLASAGRIGLDVPISHYMADLPQALATLRRVSFSATQADCRTTETAVASLIRFSPERASATRVKVSGCSK